MSKKNHIKLSIYLASTLIFGSVLLALTGCESTTLPSNVTPTATLMATEMLHEVAPGTTAIVDICDENPEHPDCVWLRELTSTPHDRAEALQTFTDPLGRFAFDFPTGWYTITITPDPAAGVRVMDTPDLSEATQWIAIGVYPNPDEASLPVWVAERGGAPWPGQVVEEEEDLINGVPVLHQRLENDDPEMGGPYEYALLWYPMEEHILLWTAWPGEQPETLNLLERMVYSFRTSIPSPK